jgi:hypothetical protein
VNNGTVSSTNEGSTSFDGTSGSNTGMENTDNGTISSDSGGNTTGSGTSTSGTGTQNNGTVTANGTGSTTDLNGTSSTSVGVDNTNGNIDETNGGSTTVNAIGNPPTLGVTPGTSTVSAGVAVNAISTAKKATGGNGGGGGGSNGVGIVGGVAILGAIGYAIFESSSAAASDSPQAMTEEDGKVAEATLDSVSVNEEGTEAVVKVRTATGTTERKLALKDSGDGVRHFALNDAGVSTELSFNPQTREYFYRESGATKNLKAHGWLKEVVASR